MASGVEEGESWDGEECSDMVRCNEKGAGGLRHCKQPSLTLKVQQFWIGGSDFSFQSYKRSMGSPIRGGTPQYHHGIEA